MMSAIKKMLPKAVNFRQYTICGHIRRNYWELVVISPSCHYSTCATLRGHLSNSWALVK